MNKSKPVDELTIEDLKQNPIWEWAIDEEENEECDETWVKPVETINFTEELNGSIVLGKLIIHNDEKFPMMCSIDIENNEVLISSIVFYNEKEDEYIAIEDVVKKVEMPLSNNINLTINEEPRALKFSADKIDIYKNIIKTNLNSN
ncbi:hypothetical protein [Bacillus cereus]|uniref:Uncharacterized protein n=1 Tax=Bacillus cereus TaxID=1396 RepID=A0A2B9DJG7_BACCE|nr:hypothetical protein [Bacillus cereus]PGM88152.1 hypothetical protein CN958_27145 [Bacillus cereus]